MKILVTGSSGCVGSALRSQCVNENDWIFVERADCDLTDRKQTIELFKTIGADYIVHLASYVPGFYNINKVASFSNNVRINENVLEAAHLNKIERGLFCLSVNMFPEIPSKLPMDESMILEGTPNTGVFAGYAYSKRMLALQCQNYNTQYNRKYYGIVPCNIYGPNDNITSGRLIPNLILKFKEAVKKNSDVTINGTGKPIRQFIYSFDLAKIIKYLVFNYQDVSPIICCSDTQISIYDLATTIGKIMGFRGQIKFDLNQPDGYLKKIVSNERLHEIIKDISFTTLETGLKETINNLVELT